MAGYNITDDVDTTDLGIVIRETLSGGSGATPIPLPDQDPSDALLIPTQGATNSISLSGKIVGDLATLQAFIVKLQKWKADGGKLSSDNITYVSALNGSFSVRVANESHDWNGGNPRTLFYSLELVEGTFG